MTASDEWCGEWEGKEEQKETHSWDATDHERAEIYWRFMGFSIRAARCLLSEGILSMNALAERTSDELRCIRNFGTITLAECRKNLALHGLKLKGD